MHISVLALRSPQLAGRNVTNEAFRVHPGAEQYFIFENITRAGKDGSVWSSSASCRSTYLDALSIFSGRCRIPMFIHYIHAPVVYLIQAFVDPLILQE